MIQVCEPTLSGRELDYVIDCVQSGWISSNGKYINQFEEEFAKYCKVKHAITCSNGSTALHLALRAIGIKEGDEVIVPDFSIISLANAVIMCGAKPVFVDSELQTWNIDISKIEEKITDKTKAILIMHTYGCPVNMSELYQLRMKYNIPIIEDAAEAHGAEFEGRKAGSLGDISIFSFYANKIITTGEGGMVCTNNDEWAKKVRSLKNLAHSDIRFVHFDIGYNYRMTNIQAAIGLAQLERIEDYVTARIENTMLYNKYLKDIEGITLPPKIDYGKNVYWMYGILIDPEKFGITARELATQLYKREIDTRTFFYPMHSQPIFKSIEEEFPIATQLYKQGLYLPSTTHLSNKDIMRVCVTIKDIHRTAVRESLKTKDI